MKYDRCRKKNPEIKKAFVQRIYDRVAETVCMPEAESKHAE